MAVEAIGEFQADRFPGVGFASPLLQQLQYADDVGRRDEAAVRFAGRVLRMDQLQLLGRYAPVAIGVLGDDAVLQIVSHQVLQPALDIRIRLVDGFAVAVLAIQHVATEG